jgi:hypothetical protein
MKKNTLLLAIAFVALVISCKKQFTDPVATFRIPDANSSMLKVNFNSIYRNNPNVQIKLNNERVSNLLTARTPFPGGGFNTGGDNRPDYLIVNAGQNNVSISIPKAGTNVDSVNILSAGVTLAPGKSYSLHTADTGTNIKHVLVEDDVTNAPAGSAKFKFVNLMPNVPAVDLYYGAIMMASRIPYLGSSPVFTMPVSSTALAWTIRESGTLSTSTALATYTSANTTQSTRSYTAFAMGYKGVATTDARRPFIAFYLNR